VEQKTIPFHLRNTHESSDETLRRLARSTGRTIPADRRNKTPKDGEIVLSVAGRSRPTQVSVHPRFLFPWEPVVGDEVVVIKGPLLGAMGMVKAMEQPLCTVTFSLDNNPVDYQFEVSELAVIED
jgi:hypothetical protein